MKKINLRVTLALLLMLSILFNACKKDETTPDAPTVTAPSAVTAVQTSASSDLTFTVAVPGGYKSSTVTANGGTATIKTDATVGATTASIVVNFTAGSTAGAGSVSITTTDNNSKTGSATAVISVTVPGSIEISTIITTNTTWTKNNKYVLKGNIYVQAPAELTIEAGTVIFGDKLTKGALIVSRGAKIHAVGTATSPIVFTSNAPKGFRNYGDWGGLVVLGKAVNNQNVSQAIEGISAATGDNGLYGGTADDDNSGELQYARIEFAGIALSTDNELNGLTMGSVGKKTKIDHIQVSYSGDDSYEWFGGTVNTSYLIAYRGWDDEFDTDFGYSGSNQFLVSYRDPNIADKSGSNGFESDNNAQGDTKSPKTSAIFSNVSFFGPFAFANPSNSTTNPAGALNTSNISSNFQRAAHIRRNSALKVFNTVFIGYRDGIFFDQTNSAAVVKGNYLGRHSGTIKLYTANTQDAVYNDANFFSDNAVNGYTPTSPLTSPNNVTSTSLDLSSNFAGGSIDFSWTSGGSGSGGATLTLSKILWNLNNPNPLLSTTSSLKSGFVNPSTSTTEFNFQTVAYRGAFDDTNNWASSTWTNYDPNNTDY
jgi:hypothetical protein